MRLDGVVVAVPEPEPTAAFFAQALDFDVRDAAGGIELWCEGDYGGAGAQRAVTLVHGDATALVELRFAARGDGPPRELTDPSGIRVVIGPGSGGGEVAPAGLRPRRLGHVNLKAPDPPAAAAFYRDALGMKLSEQIADALFFVRIGAEHHNVGIRGGERGELHHLGFEVSGWEAYRPLLDRLADLGHQVEYGPGRHEIGKNMFVYLVEPRSGLRVELFSDMAQVRDPDGYVPRRWRPEDRMTKTINRWGPLPPESFLA